MSDHDPAYDEAYPIQQYRRQPAAVRKRMEEGRWHRASHLCICETCGEEYGSHSLVQGIPWLHQLCNGDWIKP